VGGILTGLVIQDWIAVAIRIQVMEQSRINATYWPGIAAASGGVVARWLSFSETGEVSTTNQETSLWAN
jgi:hypothetical protein